MSKLVKLELTDTECLSVRMALNECAMAWGDKASAARNAGNDEDAATCERIRADYGRLWNMVNVAQEARGRVQDWLYRRPPDDVARREAREKAYAQATSCLHKAAPVAKCDYVGCSICDADNA
jgi:hypothetical protein